MGEYYKKNRKEWRKGGKYYYYKPKENDYQLIIRRGNFIISFD
jgi:beta-galactosidase beta subunit|tara:strand:+ start:169 stop:297 length:129 start_codon:yes stop_codon:yes gene_type:complete